MSDNRPARYAEDYNGGTRVVYRASGLGMCDKMFVALAMGYTPKAHPAWFQEILDEGTEHEATIREHYEAAFADVTDVGKVVELEILDGVWVRGSIDGLSHGALCEFKKVRDSGWARFLRVGVEMLPNYPFQTAFYMHALEEVTGQAVEMDFTGGHATNEGTEAEPDWQVLETFTHHYTDPPVPLIAIKKRIAKLERLILETTAIGDMKCNVEMFPCPMFYLHDETMDETPERPTTDIVTDNLRRWIEITPRVAEINRELKTLVEQQVAIKEGVQAWLVAAGQDSGEVCTVTVDGVSVGLKYVTFPSKGYVVEPKESTRVTIAVEGVPKATKVSKGKTASKTDKTQEAELVMTETLEAEGITVKGPRKLAPR